MDQDRRASPRLRSSARILWSTLGSDYFQVDRLRDVSVGGARIDTEAVPRVNEEIRFDLLDDLGGKIATGLARVVRVADGDVGICFVALGVDDVLVATLVAAEANAKPVVPPPLPPSALAAAGMQPVVDDAHEDGSEEEAPESDDPAFVQIEPLAMQPGGVVIGIDLGTTNTCASYAVDGQARIVPTPTGSSTMPSVVHFDDSGAVHVGHRAAGRQVLYPGSTVYGSKRLLGRTYKKKVAQELQEHFAYRLARAKGQRFGVRIGKDVVSMDAIATHILHEVRSSAEASLGVPIAGAVISVPAYFSEVQREAVRRAAAAASLPVYRIVNEPTAAAIAYGYKQEKRARVAVWDFGGGTFDISIVDVKSHELTVLATGGDGFLGGADFDQALVAHVLAEFMRIEKLGDFVATPQQLARLREACELAKRALSVQAEHVVEIRELTSAPVRDLRVEVTRERFDELTRHLVERAVAIAREVMESEKLVPTEVDDVVLVGGTTRIPAVQHAVTRMFGRRPSVRINADEAVALGAGLLAAEIADGQTPTLHDVLPMSVGNGAPGGRMEVLVARNARLPAHRTSAAKIDANGIARLPLFQGEALKASGNEYIGTARASGVDLPAGTAVVFKLSFDEHCTMSVEAVEARSGRALAIDLDRTESVEKVLADLEATGGDGTPAARPTRATRSARKAG